MKKKSIIASFMIGVCIIGILMTGGCTAAQTKFLPRDSDTEFRQGSKLMKQDISSEQAEALYKLCKVWGYGKYHHPDVISGKINWDAELFRVMPKVLKAADSYHVNEVLLEWVKGFPVDAVADNLSEDSRRWIEIQEKQGKQKLDLSWIENTDFLGKELSSYLCQMSDFYISDRKHAYASFDEMGTVTFKNEKMYDISDGDMGMYFLGLFRFWNIYEYYSPNVGIATEDWDVVLNDAIPKFAKLEDNRSYGKAIAEVVAKTGDAHCLVIDKEQFLYYYYGKYFLPCDIKIIDQNVVVTQVKQGENALLPGDILLEIDGISLERRIEEQKKYHALPEENKLLNQLKHLLVQAEGEKAEVLIQRGTERKAVQLNTLKNQYHYENPLSNGRLDSFHIGYLDPSQLKKGDLEMLMKEFGKTEGIIVDLRYYPSTEITYSLSEYINPDQKIFARIGFPNQAIPGAFYQVAMVSGKGTLEAEETEKAAVEAYSGKVILLMDEGTQSQSEFTVMSLRQAPKALVVGNPSIGADGNITMVRLPGNLVFPISGLGVYTPEGEQTQRCGLKPDVECWQTIEGISAGKDELLEQAVRLILE